MVRRGMVGCVLAVALGACGSDEPPVPRGVSGPLCAALPSGDDPGAPSTLTGETANVALTWIPVATTFEAAVRTSGLELEDVTVLAPSDDAFAAAIDRQELDDILLSRARSRELVAQHMVDEPLSLAELLDAEEVTTRAGARLAVGEAEDGQARLGDRARTVCADYAASGARIHVIDGVLR